METGNSGIEKSKKEGWERGKEHTGSVEVLEMWKKRKRWRGRR